MQDEQTTPPVDETRLFGGPPLRRTLLVVLFLAAFGLRLCHIDKPPFEFHGDRQCRSTLIARALFLKGLPGEPQWRKDVAAAAVETLDRLEPPVMESLTALGYHLMGRENLVLPRAMSVLFWLVGGVFLYRIAARTASPDAGVFAVTFYLFLPFAVVASRSFQPDPLMVMLALCGIWCVLRYDEGPSAARLVGASVVCAAAVVVKPICAFVLLASFPALLIGRQGVVKALRSRALYIFCGAALLPALLYYGHGLFLSGSLANQAQMSFAPRLFVNPVFWGRWLRQILTVIGPASFVAGLIGIAFFGRGRARALLVGLWVGYFLFGLVFNYHVHTHDYYQLQLIPIVAVSLGPVCTHVLDSAVRRAGSWLRVAAVCALLVLAPAFSFVLVHRQIREQIPGMERQVAVAQEIGRRLSHSTKTLVLNSKANELQYYGEFAGRKWPNPLNLRLRKQRGLPPVIARELMRRRMEEFAPEYFVIGDLDCFKQMSDLRELLFGEYRVFARGDDFLIFDLRGGPPDAR